MTHSGLAEVNTGRTGGAAATKADPTEDPAPLPARGNRSPEATREEAETLRKK